MTDVLGLLNITVRRGINLAVRDTIRSASDPYVVITIGQQKSKTRVMKRNCNPTWNEVLVFRITDPNVPINLAIFDKDTFSRDDQMGIVAIDVKPYIAALKMAKGLHNLPSRCVLKRIQPGRSNCLAEESSVVWENGKVTQDMRIMLQDVERGEISLQLGWTEVPGCKGLESEAMASPWSSRPLHTKKHR